MWDRNHKTQYVLCPAFLFKTKGGSVMKRAKIFALDVGECPILTTWHHPPMWKS